MRARRLRLLDAIRYHLDEQGQQIRDPAFKLIEAYRDNRFIWVCSPAILAEYEYQFKKLLLPANIVTSSDRRKFDKPTFYGVVTAIARPPGYLEPTQAEDEEADSVIMDPSRAEHLRDPNDYQYLSAADHLRKREAEAVIVVGSSDSDLYTLNNYKGIPIVRPDRLLSHIGVL